MERLFPFCRLILCLNDGVISVHKMFSSMRYLLLTVVLLSTLLGSCLKEFFFLCYKFKHTTYFVFYQIHGNRSYTELRSWIYPELSFVWGDRQWIYSFCCCCSIFYYSILPASFVEDTSVFPVCTFHLFVNCQVSLDVRNCGRVFNNISLTSAGIFGNIILFSLW